MYGVLVGKAQQSIASGSWINTTNVKHASGDFKTGERNTHWSVPDVSKYQGELLMDITEAMALLELLTIG